MSAVGAASLCLREPIARGRAFNYSDTLVQVLDELVVLFVGANPEPDNELALTARERAIMVSDSRGPDIRAERLELH